MGRKFTDLKGQKFGRLTVLDFDKRLGHNVYWLCQCECGNIKSVSSWKLKSGHTKSCGCLQKELAIKNGFKHGLIKTRLYRIYSDIKTRCFNKNYKKYKTYGGRGITMCDEWLNDFMSFYNWSMNNGYQENLTIDRIDVNGNYEPTNCRWADIVTQANNRRNNRYITYNNETHTLSEWCKLLNLNYDLVQERIQRLHWEVEKAFYTEVQRKR